MTLTLTGSLYRLVTIKNILIGVLRRQSDHALGSHWDQSQISVDEHHSSKFTPTGIEYNSYNYNIIKIKFINLTFIYPRSPRCHGNENLGQTYLQTRFTDFKH